MEIIPAIDVKDGKCVRLRQGRENTGTVYDADPVSVALRWKGEGARRLHVVNLDGAFGRESKGVDLLGAIAALPGVSVQFGGGLRSWESIRSAFDAGASSVVLGTIAFENRDLLDRVVSEFGPANVIVALDALGGNVATRGWTELTGMEVHAAALDLRRTGILRVLFTDISRDGMLSGPDLATLRSLADSGLSVIASGGISSLDDIRDLLAPQYAHVTGAIIGKALYEGTIALPAAISLASGAGTEPATISGKG